MLARLRAWVAAEVEPVFAEWPPQSAFVLLLGTALLINKRYLADESYGGASVTRWQILAAWLLASVVFALGLRAHRAGKLAWWLPGLLGGLAMVAALTPAGFLFGNWRFSPLDRAEPLGMLLLTWMVITPAALACTGSPARCRTGELAALAGLLVCLACLTGLGPLRQMMTDARLDRLGWCLLSCCWLFLGSLSLGLPVLGGHPREDGLQLGRWRFWLPVTLVLLAGMALLIGLVIARDPSFTSYYPMYKRDWPDYDPRRDGWGFYAAYTLAFGAYFLGWEYFFRGWMLFRLERELGGLAIVVQTVPFVIMHIGKPGLEIHSSLVAGLVLGWLALRGRSFWPCFLLHWGAAATMDALALLRGLA